MLSGRSSLGHFGYAILIALAVLAIFMLFFGYFIAFEWLWNGRTPGKRALGIRVMRDGGFPVDFTSSLIRNVVRILEFGLAFYAISALSTLLSPQNRRLGDFAAGTIVVRDRFADAQASGLPAGSAGSRVTTMKPLSSFSSPKSIRCRLPE